MRRETLRQTEGGAGQVKERTQCRIDRSGIMKGCGYIRIKDNNIAAFSEKLFAVSAAHNLCIINLVFRTQFVRWLFRCVLQSLSLQGIFLSYSERLCLTIVLLSGHVKGLYSHQGLLLSITESAICFHKNSSALTGP